MIREEDESRQFMNIVCATDDNYVPLCGIMLTSLFENNRDSHVVVYILTKGITKKNRSKFNKLLHDRRYDAEIHICEINDDYLTHCPIRKGDHISLAAYYRFLIPVALPANVDKVLYLDCDLLINNSLRNLYATDIDEVAIAASEDLADALLMQKNIARLGYPVSWSYFNSGVMLINVSYWRQHGIIDILFEYVSVNGDNCLYHDQDVLNAVLGNQKKIIPYKYNFSQFTLGFDQAVKSKLFQEAPVIIHYTAAKPWDWYLPNYPFKKRWEFYKSISPWRFWKGNKPMKEKIKRRLISWFYTLRGKNFPYYDDSWKKWDE